MVEHGVEPASRPAEPPRGARSQVVTGTNLDAVTAVVEPASAAREGRLCREVGSEKVGGKGSSKHSSTPWAISQVGEVAVIDCGGLLVNPMSTARHECGWRQRHGCYGMLCNA